MGDITTSVVPKVAIVSSSKNYDIYSHYFDPFVLHDSHAVTGAIALSAATVISDTIANKFLSKQYNISNHNRIKIEHISGYIETIIDFDKSGDISSASSIRTSSILMDGNAFLYN